jgi:O-acetylhomoserine/O-acetylserine sulfhydrylase-like pyridoxal-dependent enzyme
MKSTANDLEAAQFETIAVHAGEYVDPATRSSSPNLVMSSTFAPRELTGFSARDEEAIVPIMIT